MFPLSTAPVLWWIVCLLTQAPTPIPGPEDNDFAPLIFLLLIILVCFVLLGIGIVLALVGVVCAAALTAMGIVTAATAMAVLRRRVSAGVRAFHYQICATVGAPAGVMLLWGAAAVFDLQWRLRSILAAGALAGIVAGLLLAGVLDWTARVVYRRILLTGEISNATASVSALPR